MRRTPDVLPGTLDLLILRTLQRDALHGWDIAERIQQVSRDEAGEWERMANAIGRVIKFA